MLERLAVEAGVRGLGIAELVGELISLTVEKGLTKQVLDGPPDLQGAALAAPLGSTSR